MTSATPSPAPAPLPDAALPHAAPRRRRRWVLPLALLLVLALAAAAALVVLRGRDDTAAGPATAVAFPVAAVSGGADGSAEGLGTVVAHERRFVAAGSVSSGGRNRPVFLFSDDLGVTWKTAPVEDPDDLVGASEFVSSMTTGPRGLVALGASNGRAVLWTSPDGADWTRRALDKAVFQEDDSVSALRGVPTGYVAVGGTSPESGATRGVLWDSLDGVEWRRRTAPQLGIKTPDGRRGDTFNDVAADGSTLVVAGGEFDQSNASSKDNIAFWRSTDGGRRFARDATPLDVGGDNSRSRVRSVVAAGGVFYAVGNGGDFDLFEDYDPVLLTSRGDGAWRRTPDGQLAGDGEDFLVDVTVTAGGALVSVGSNGEAPLVVDGRPATARRAPAAVSAVKERPTDLVSVASIGDVVVAVGSHGARGDDDALLLRRQGTAPFAVVALPEVDALAEATVVINDVTTRADGTLVAAGASGGDGVLYTSPDGRTWTQLPVPATLAGGRRGQYLTGLAPAADGAGFVAVGTSDRELSHTGILLRSTDGTTLEDAGEKGLLVADNEFADRELSAAAVRGATTVYVGRSDDGDPHTSALALRTGPDGQLSQASAANPSFGDESRPDDLKGAPGRGRGMQDVAASRAGFLAVGYVNTGLDKPYVPGVWSSNDGARWALEQLPLPKGTENAYLQAVAATETGWVATGVATQGDLSLPYAWSSPDGNRWTATALPVDPERSASVGSVVVTPEGTVALGSSTSEGGETDGDTDAAGWISRDGTTWEPLSLPGVARGDGQQYVSAATVSGDSVVALGSAVTKEGVRTLVVRLGPEDLSLAREG